MQDNIFEVINPDSDFELILTAEHAEAKIPEKYQNLGLDKSILDTHIARDKGVKQITQILAKKLNCYAIMGKYSRLLIDLNRKKDENELIVTTSDKIVIPNNQNISAQEKSYRLENYYAPYYNALEEKISHLQKLGKKPIIFSIHSYTPQLKDGVYRPWHAGILYNKPTNLANFIYNELCLSDKNIGQNVPYDLRKYNTGTAIICGQDKGFDYALIEIRDDEFDNLEYGAKYWADILEKILVKYFNKKALKE